MALTLFKKSQSPFILFQEQSDKLIKDINKDLKKCTSELKKKSVDEITKKYLGEICQRDLDKIAVEKEKLSQLTEESEPKPIQKFEIKKEEKLKKLHNLEIQVNDVYSMLDVNRQSSDPQTDKDKSEINAKKGDDSPKNLDGDDDDYDEEEEDEDDEDGDENDGEYNNGDVIKSLKTNLQSIKGLNDDLINKEDEEEEEEEDDDDDDDDGKSKTSKSSEMDDNINATTTKSSEISQKKSVTLITNKSDDDEEEGDDNDDSDDDDGEEEVANETINLPDGANMFVAIKSFPGQEEGDLSFKKNEKLKVMNIRSDGWMMAENDKGEQGLVPGNFFEKFSDPQDEDDKPKDVEEKKHPDDDSDDDDDDDDEEDEEEEDELMNEPDEDIRVIKPEKAQKIKTKMHKSVDLWTQLRESVHLSEEKKIDLIKSLSSVPSGYREPTLSKLSTKRKFSLNHCMHPCLSISGLNYEDLTMNSQTHEVEHRKSKIQCIIDLISIRNLPLPTDISVIKILDRHVRVVLFDGKKFLSNFLVIKIPIVEEYNWWKFSSHRNSPSSEFSQLFIRSNSLSTELGVLFEVATMLQTEIETVELSCGWSFFKLLTDDDGLPVPNKTYQLPMYGGTPYEKGIPIDKKSDQARSRKFSFVSVLNSIKDSPIFTIKLSSPKKSQNLHLLSLPEMMIGQTSNLMFLFLYRQYLLDALIRYRNDLHSIEVLHSPLLTSLTEILEQPNLIDVLRTSWSEKTKSLSRSEKKIPEVMKSSFLTVFMENVYPLMFLARLKKMNHHNILEWKNRNDEVHKFIESQSGNKMSGLSLFTKPNVPLMPFDTQELTFNLLDSTLEK